MQFSTDRTAWIGRLRHQKTEVLFSVACFKWFFTDEDIGVALYLILEHALWLLVVEYLVWIVGAVGEYADAITPSLELVAIRKATKLVILELGTSVVR